MAKSEKAIVCFLNGGLEEKVEGIQGQESNIDKGGAREDKRSTQQEKSLR